MKSVEFCYWLQGFFELHHQGSDLPITAGQAVIIQKHLALVFKHEIDPSYPDSAALDAIHNPPVKPKTHVGGGSHGIGGLVMRC